MSSVHKGKIVFYFTVLRGTCKSYMTHESGYLTRSGFGTRDGHKAVRGVVA